MTWYNHVHLHSAIGFVTPDPRHCGDDVDLLEHRATVYEAARRRNPRRWASGTRSWRRVDVVNLNPRDARAAQDVA